MFERPPRQSSAAGLIVTTNGQKQTRETFTTGLSYQDRHDARAVIQIRTTNTATANGSRRTLLLSIQQTHNTVGYPLPYTAHLHGRRQILSFFIPTCRGFFYLLPIIFWNEEKPFSLYMFGELLTSCCPCCPTRAVCQMN